LTIDFSEFAPKIPTGTINPTVLLTVTARNIAKIDTDNVVTLHRIYSLTRFLTNLLKQLKCLAVDRHHRVYAIDQSPETEKNEILLSS